MRGTQEERENLSIHRPWQGENRFLERVFEVEAFKKLYLARLDEFARTIFKPERLASQVDELAARIRPAVKEESDERLARFDKAVAGESIGPAAFAFGGPIREGESERGREPAPERAGRGPREPLKPIKPFVKIRAQSVLDQLAGKPGGQTPGELGFGGRGGRGGRGGPGGFGPGNFLGRFFMDSLDADKSGDLAREEFTRGFARWFEAWDAEKSGALTEEALRAGIDRQRPHQQ